jgi:carboxyl-terminal processing protease
MRRNTFRNTLSLVVALWGLAAPSLAGAEISCSTIPEFTRLYLRSHVRYHQLDEEIKRRSIENYLLRLDPSRTLLTQPEVEAMRASLDGVFDEVRAGHCTLLNALNKRLVLEYERAAKFVRDFVSSESYEIDTTASLIIDPEVRGYPKNDEERDDLLRRLVHFQMSNYVSNDTELEEAKKKLIRRYERRLRRFLDTTSDETYSAFLDAFASALDPHSNYLPAEVLEDFRIGMSLSLEGIGVALSEQDGYAVAERIIPGGAADRQNVLRPKDKIIAVAQEGEEFVDIIDMPLRDSVGLIRGKAGTKVRLTILRQGEKTEKFNIEIERAEIDLTEQAAKLRFEEHEVDGKTYKLAVLTLPSFYGDSDPSKRQCTDDVARLLREAREKGADGLLLDLSRNGGGLLQHAVTISGFFIRRGEIVSIEDARGRWQILADRDDDILYSGPMVVYISRVSASASEILAGALKDYGRAVIVGDDHTFGKGTVQTVSQLPADNGALKITTALFFRPGGRSTQHSGVGADIVLPSTLSSDDYGEKSQRYSLPPEETTPFLGDAANAEAGAQHWEPVQGDLVALLAERSKSRVASSQEFEEVREKLAEVKESKGVVHLDELMKRREEEAADSHESKDTATNADDEEPPEPQLEEAVLILSDFVALSQQRAAAREAPRPES